MENLRKVGVCENFSNPLKIQLHEIVDDISIRTGFPPIIYVGPAGKMLAVCCLLSVL